MRIDDSVLVGESLFLSQRWWSVVRLYAARGTEVRARACPDGSQEDHSLQFVFAGRLR